MRYVIRFSINEEAYSFSLSENLQSADCEFEKLAMQPTAVFLFTKLPSIKNNDLFLLNLCSHKDAILSLDLWFSLNVLERKYTMSLADICFPVLRNV